MAYIGVIDSGVGGVSVLKECVKRAPQENYVYLADTKNSPYGSKSKMQIYKSVLSCIYRLLEEYNIKLIIIACNTATAVCIDRLRQMFGLPIIGVEPAIKVALSQQKDNIILLCTPATKKYSHIIKYYKKYKKLTIVTQKKWARLIDNNIDNISKIDQAFRINTKCTYDCIIIGCTHYCFVKNNIIINNNVDIIDSNSYVAERLVEKLRYHNLSEHQHRPRYVFEQTGHIDNFVSNMTKIFLN